MTEGFAMRWPVRQTHPVTADCLNTDNIISDAILESWIDAACCEFLNLCTVLTDLQARSELSLVRKPPKLRQSAAQLSRPATVVVSASVPELGSSSFTVAIRLRPRGGDDVGRMIDTSCVVRLQHPAGGAVPLSANLRRQLIAIERRARHHN